MLNKSKIQSDALIVGRSYSQGSHFARTSCKGGSLRCRSWWNHRLSLWLLINQKRVKWEQFARLPVFVWLAPWNTALHLHTLSVIMIYWCSLIVLWKNYKRCHSRPSWTRPGAQWKRLFLLFILATERPCQYKWRSKHVRPSFCAKM